VRVDAAPPPAPFLCTFTPSRHSKADGRADAGKVAEGHARRERAERERREAEVAAQVEVVRRAFPSWKRSILTEIHLCHACSYQEIEDGGKSRSGRRSRRSPTPGRPSKPSHGRRAPTH
jgi:hypothetical protein